MNIAKIFKSIFFKEHIPKIAPEITEVFLIFSHKIYEAKQSNHIKSIKVRPQKVTS